MARPTASVLRRNGGACLKPEQIGIIFGHGELTLYFLTAHLLGRFGPRIEPAMNFRMAIGKGGSARAVMVAGGEIHQRGPGASGHIDGEDDRAGGQQGNGAAAAAADLALRGRRDAVHGVDRERAGR